MTRCLAALAAVVLSLASVNRTSAADKLPNIVFILADDLGYADLGFTGCVDIPTPNLDRLLARSTVIANAQGVTCAPSRARVSILSRSSATTERRYSAPQ